MKKIISVLTILLVSFSSIAQEKYMKRPNFWHNVKFGGGFGLAAGDDFGSFSFAPMAYKPIDPKTMIGVGLQYNYLSQKNYYRSSSYGINLVAIYAPVSDFELFAEWEQLKVSVDYSRYKANRIPNSKYWSTAIFLGAGYRAGNLSAGIKYNLLYQKDNFIYTDAWLPFVRIYF